jgi:hypothetical protein
MEKRRLESTRLHEFFLHIARKSFCDLGVDDEAIVGYVAGLMTEFASASRLYALRASRRHDIDSALRILIATSQLPQTEQDIKREREMRRYVGDYTLFMSGLFRRHVEKTGALGYYLEEGRRSYWAVSELDLTMFRTGFLLFQQLSTNFEYYSGALDYMRKAYFTPAPGEHPFSEFLRHIEGWISVNVSDN